MTISAVPPSLYNICRSLALNDNDLTVLDLAGLNLGNAGASAIGCSLHSNYHLKSLSISYNLISSGGAVRLLDSGVPNLEILDMRHNSIGNEGAHTLADILPAHTKLKRLSIRDNYIGSSGGTAIADAVCENISLEHLDLGTNALGIEGASAVRRLLETNKQLKSLCLWSCEMDAEGIMEIAEGLRVNTSLETLNLGGNRIGSDGAMYLAEVMRVNTTLRSLHLDNCQIGPEGAFAMASVLEENKTLSILDILHNPIGIDGATSFCKNLKDHNRTLNELRLDYQFTSRSKLDYDDCIEGVNAEITLYLKLNQVGRGKMVNPNLPWSFWPSILKKVSCELDLMYLVMQEKPELLPRCDSMAVS